MIEKTIFENDKEIIDIIKEKYGIDIQQVEKINRGSANLYSLNNQTYILKEFLSKSSLNDVVKEINVVHFLDSQNIPVPKYIKLLNQQFHFTYKNKIFVMQEYMKGDILKQNEGNEQQTIESATYLGKIVVALENYPNEYELPYCDISNWYLKKSFNDSIKKHNNLLSLLTNSEIDKKIEKDLKDKIIILKELKKNIFPSKELEKITYKNTHGDYNINQFIYEKGKIKGIVDFESVCKMPIIWEIIRSYSYIDKEFDIENFISYVKEFSNYVPLNTYDLKYMANTYLIQILHSTFGYKQYLANRENQQLLNFAFFRTNLCRYLYKNEKEISKKLLLLR